MDERSLVERVDACLVTQAKSLSRLDANEQVSEQLDRMLDQAKMLDDRTLTEDGWVLGLPHKHVMIPYYRQQLESIADGCWTDLVCPNDYFGPTGGMMRREPLPKGVTEGAMVVSLNPHLRHVGDLISLCMLQRIRTWLGLLTHIRSCCYESSRKAVSSYKDLTDIEQKCWTSVSENWKSLQSICIVGADARIRESCMIAVQVVADFHPTPDLDWLGLDPYAIARFQGLLRATCVSRRDLPTLDRIATALNSLHNIYQNLDPTVSAIDEAIATGGLVMIEKTQQAFWEGNKAGESWSSHRKPWELIWHLAKGTRLATSVDQSDLYDNIVSDSTMHNRARRLRDLLPATLARLIVSGNKPATYRLDLPPDKVHLFD